MSDPVLICDGLDAGYDQGPVVRRFDLVVGAGEIVAILGPNGAGKTTLLLTLAGLLAPLRGSIEFAGEPVSARRPDRNARRGLVLVPDSRELVTSLTTRENLLLAQRRGGASIDDCMEMFPALAKRLNTRAGALSGGEQQMVALARALLQRPQVLLVDEMALGLAPRTRADLFRRVQRTARELKMAAVLVEQHVDLVLGIADRALVLVHGETRLAMPARDLLEDRRLLEQAYLAG